MGTKRKHGGLPSAVSGAGNSVSLSYAAVGRRVGGKAPRLAAMESAGSAAGAVSRFGFGFRGASLAKGAVASTSNQSEELPQREAAKIKQEPETCADGPRSSGRNTLKQRSASVTSLVSVRKAIPSTGASALLQRPFTSVRKPSVTRADATNGSAAGERTGGGKENNDPTLRRPSGTVEPSATTVAPVTQVHDAFTSSFGGDKLEEVDKLLAFIPKADKFNSRAQKEEQLGYIRRLKAALKSVSTEIRQFGILTSAMDNAIVSERATLERRLSALEETARDNSQLTLELERMQVQFREIQNTNARLQKSEAEALSSKSKLQETLDAVQEQLQQAQKKNDQLELELKAHEARMSDRAQYFEEKKKELEHFYQKKDLEEEKRKNLELETLQEKLSRAREEIATAIRERDSHKERVNSVEAELKLERERRTKTEMDKCTLEAQNKSLEIRLSGGSSEAAELKDKLKQRDEELTNLVKSMTEIQKFTASASSKVETEKKELANKVDALQLTIRDLEKKETISENTINDLQKQLLAAVTARNSLERTVEQLRGEFKEMESQLQEASRKTSVEAGVRQMLEDQMREMRTEHVAVNAQLEAVKAEMKRLQIANDDTKTTGAQRLVALEEKHKAEKAKLQAQIEQLQEERVSLESEVSTLRVRANSVRDNDLEELCVVKREADVLRRRLKELSNQGAQSMAEKNHEIEELQEKLRQGDKLRRMMHNTIQELRGNVRVFARARPFLPSDHCDPEASSPVISCDYDGQSIKLRRPGKSSSSDLDTYAFKFDKVFAPSAGQDAVFEEVAEFVQSALDGYHVCLFSYGQTGSGKTHTMQGSGNGQMRGIIPRAIEKVLGECEHLKEQGWSYTTQVSFLEIYNETLKDLLVSKADATGDKKLAIKKDPRGSVCVPDLTLVDVTSIDQVEALMERASRARSVACTDMNAQSSRSHSVFTLHVQGTNESQGIVLDGKLNLVDLAGSERASRSNVSGDRLKETQAINKSLSCLADVFAAIGNKSAHIPFRNSKLTYLLQSSLSGDGKTLMMVNLSPTPESASESLCSLRFAQHVNQCELGKPKRQIKSKQDQGV